MKRKAAAYIFAVLLPFAVQAGPVGPTRIVSVNHCADQFLLHLGLDDQIAALSFMAVDGGLSPHAERAAHKTLVHGSAEEILPLGPDLVVGGTFGASFALQRLAALGVPTVRLAPVTSLTDMDARLAEIGTITRREDVATLAQAQLAEGILRLRQGAANLTQRPTALAIEARGMVAGEGSLRHELMQLAGLRNLAAERGLGAYAQLGLEDILTLNPDILIFVPYAADRPALSENLFSHPAFAAWRKEGRLITIPNRTFNCGTPRALQAAYAMQQAAQNFEGGGQ